MHRSSQQFLNRILRKGIATIVKADSIVFDTRTNPPEVRFYKGKFHISTMDVPSFQLGDTLTIQDIEVLLTLQVC